MSESVLYNVTDHIATIRLNRPKQRNAMDFEGYARLTTSVMRANDDPDVRCLILTGTGSAFCAGDDFAVLSGEGLPVDANGQPRQLELPGRALRRCSKPIIAAINGVAVGYGLELIVLSDFRFAAEVASFSAMYIRRSLVAPADSWERLPEIVGPEAAAELLLTGDQINAKRALEIGLVSKVVPQSELMRAARDLGARLTSNPPLALQAAKQALILARTRDRKALCNHINKMTAELQQTEDFAESIRAFRERRSPQFKGQ